MGIYDNDNNTDTASQIGTEIGVLHNLEFLDLHSNCIGGNHITTGEKVTKDNFKEIKKSYASN